LLQEELTVLRIVLCGLEKTGEAMKIGSVDDWKTWALEGWIGWFSVGLLTLGAVWLYAASPTQNSIRLTGFVYEVIGIVVVFIEIAKASGRNKLTPLHRRIAAYLRRLPLLPQNKNVLLAAASATLSVMGGRARLSIGRPPNATLDQRVEHLERQVNALDDRIEAVDVRIEEEEKARGAAIAAERAARERALRVNNP
jgi:hypothetical protein